MSTQVNEGSIRALFSADSLSMRPYDGTWAKGLIVKVFQAQTHDVGASGPLASYLYRTITTCGDVKAPHGLFLCRN